MKKEFSQELFFKTLNQKKHKKDIKLIVEGKRIASGEYVLIPKEMIISKELFQELGFQERIIDPKGVTVARAKQKSTREILLSFIETQLKFNKKVDRNFRMINKDLKLIKSLPTIKKELDQVKEQNQER